MTQEQRAVEEIDVLRGEGPVYTNGWEDGRVGPMGRSAESAGGVRERRPGGGGAGLHERLGGRPVRAYGDVPREPEPRGMGGSRGEAGVLPRPPRRPAGPRDAGGGVAHGMTNEEIDRVAVGVREGERGGA